MAWSQIIRLICSPSLPAHAQCLGYSKAMQERVQRVGGWRCMLCRVCLSCGLRIRGSSVVNCTQCDRSCHAVCLPPAMNSGINFVCNTCRRLGPTSPAAATPAASPAKVWVVGCFYRDEEIIKK